MPLSLLKTSGINQSVGISKLSWTNNSYKAVLFGKDSCLSQPCCNKSMYLSPLISIATLVFLCMPFYAFAGSCNIGEIWPGSGSVTYPDQAKYGKKYKAVKKRVTFGPDAAFRTNLDSEHPFYVIVVRHAGSGTEKAVEGHSRNLGRGRHSYEFTADYRDYPQDEMELLIYAGEEYQNTRYKINVTFTTVACK